MKPIRNIVFDFDGTLADTAALIVATMKATATELGLTPKTEKEIRATIGIRLEDVPAILWPGSGVESATFASTYRRIFDERKLDALVECFPSVTETLRRLKESGVAMAIASSRSRKSLVEYMERLGIGQYFEMALGGDDVSNGKPSPEPVERILSGLGWKAYETLTVGDAAVDIEMGRAAGTQTCGVTYGYGSEASMQTAKPDFTIDEFCELIKICGV